MLGFRLTSDEQIDVMIKRCKMHLICGLVLLTLALSQPFGWTGGGLTGFALFSNAVFTFALRRWRSELGLWMLATLLTVVFLPTVIVLEFEGLRQLLGGKNLMRLINNGAINWWQVRLLIDAAVALWIFRGIATWTLSVAIKNWHFSRNWNQLDRDRQRA